MLIQYSCSTRTLINLNSCKFLCRRKFFTRFTQSAVQSGWAQDVVEAQCTTVLKKAIRDTRGRGRSPRLVKHKEGDSPSSSGSLTLLDAGYSKGRFVLFSQWTPFTSGLLFWVSAISDDNQTRIVLDVFLLRKILLMFWISKGLLFLIKMSASSNL